MKKLIALLLVILMALTLVGCNKDNDTETGGDELSYDEQSAAIYDAQLGEFYDTYMAAKENASTISERYALMAVAEAKLMESAVMLPISTQGGNYAISRVAPYTVDFTLWGNDLDRFHSVLVTTEFIKTEDIDAMKAHWNETKGDGTYLEWAKNYLTTHGYELSNTYSLAYTSDPMTWDALVTSRAADSEAIVNTYDGLYEYDAEGILQPALATGYTVSDDGTVYTFTLRDDVNWVDSQGRVLYPVVADDFVAGMQHMLDANGGPTYIVTESALVSGSGAYVNDPSLDFSTVGVKAIDEHTVEYTLDAPCSYFLTMLGYNVFAPMSRAYYESLGGKFGAEYDASAADYNYGKSPDTIAYCGPYLVTNNTAESKIVFSRNESYYAPEKINVDEIVWLFNDGSDVMKTYNDAKAGVLSGAGLTTSAVENCKNDGLFDDYAYISSTTATTFMGFINLNRQAYANVSDGSVATAQSEADQARTHTALQNVHFRRALCFSMDRVANNAQKVGDVLAPNSLRNSYTPWNFVFLEEETTIDINGTPTTFAAGTSYGEIMQYQIDADGVALTVYDPAQPNGGDSFDGWYNPANAAAELAIAVEELKAEGVEVSAENPIYIDLPYATNSEIYTNAANAYKQSVESALGGAVILSLTQCADNDQWFYAGYYTDYGYEANYDIYDLSGWGPDYGDPSTYLDTFLPEYSGYMAKCLGIY